MKAMPRPRSRRRRERWQRQGWQRKQRHRPKKPSSPVVESPLSSLSAAVSAFTALDNLMSASLKPWLLVLSTVHLLGLDTRACLDFGVPVHYSGAGDGSAALIKKYSRAPRPGCVCFPVKRRRWIVSHCGQQKLTSLLCFPLITVLLLLIMVPEVVIPSMKLNVTPNRYGSIFPVDDGKRTVVTCSELE